MNPQETQQVIAHDEKWVPSAERVTISPTNLRLETIGHQKEEKFQVIIDVIKNSICFKAFTISTDKCLVDAEVFRKILDIYPRVEGEEFTKLQDDDATLTFLIDLGYKGPLHKHTSMYVDHMHQPCRTLAVIINKCLSGKTASNGRLRKSRIDILWGMFYKENVDYLELIWEDFAFQIDHRKEKKSRCETIPFPRFTKVIINHFLSQHKSLFNLKYQHYHTIKDDGIVSRLKFVRIAEDYQEYGLPILDMMLNDKIKQSESYQMFIKYSTCQIPPKKSRGKGSQRKKTADTLVIDVMVSEESDTEPSTKRTASRSVIKKKATISVVDNIIPDPDVALELSKSISLTEAIEEETTRQVHATHARIVTKSVPEPARRRPSEQEAADTMQALKESKKTSRRQPGTGGSSEGTGMIPGVLNESTVISATSVKEKVTLEANVILEWGSKQESEYLKEDKKMTDDEETKDEFVHGDEQVNDDEHEEMSNVEVKDSRKGDAELSDVAKADAEKIEEIKDDAKKSKLPPTNSSFSISSSFGDQFLKLSYDTSLVSTIKDTTDAKINSLLNIKIQYEVPHIQSPYVLIVLVLVIFEPSVLTPIPETPSVALATTLLTPSSVSTTPHVPYQTTVPIPTPPIITDAPTITIVVTETNALTDVQLRVGKLEKDVSELKKIDYSAETLASLKSQVPTVVDSYLGSKFGDVLQKELQKHTTGFIQKHYVKQTPESSKIQKPTIDLEQESEKSASEIYKIKREQDEKQKMPKYTSKSTDKATLKEYDQKSALYQAMHENKSFNRNLANLALYHALMEALIEDENAMDKGVADTVKNHKRQHDDDDDDDDDDEDSSVGPNQGKKTKRTRTKESESSKKPSTTNETSKVIDTLLTNEATSDQEMDDTYITMEECIQLMADKGHMRGQEFNWETATYGKREHEEIEIFINEFRTTNELLLKERSNLLSELKIEVNELSKVVGNVLVPKNKVKGVTTMGGRMTSKATPSKEDKDLMLLKSKFNDDEPWYADFVNYIVRKVVSPNWNFKKRKRFFLQVKTYFWEEPYAFKLCEDNIIRRCVAESEILKILGHCHSGPTSGHHGDKVTARKVYQSGFYWPGVFKDANEYVRRCDVCQRSENISSRDEMPQNNIQIEHKAHWALKQCNMDLKLGSKSRLLQLNELSELRVGAYENTRIYKERTKKWHDSRLRGEKYFKEGDKVLLYNSHLKMYPGKLKSKWSGSNIVKTVYPYKAVEIIDEKGFSFKVNGQRLKKYYEGNIDKEDHEVIEFKNGIT
ncbi:retrovirus-related pol polyprotein from transposon TNT 1-94 [Tanacetum coccineum]